MDRPKVCPHSSAKTYPIAPAAIAIAAIPTPVSAAPPPEVTFVGQSIEESVVIVVVVEFCMLVVVIVEFAVILAEAVTVELETDILVGMALAEASPVAGMVVILLPAPAAGDAEAAVRAGSISVPQ